MKPSKCWNGIVFEGYKGWNDSIAVRMANSYLEDLSKAGVYDRNLVLAYARQTKHESSIEKLKKILDEFDRTQTAGADRRWVL